MIVTRDDILHYKLDNLYYELTQFKIHFKLIQKELTAKFNEMPCNGSSNIKINKHREI